MIYCNLSGDRGVKIVGTGKYIRDELAALFTELNKTDIGRELIRDALEQSDDPDWQDLYDSEIRAFPDPNRRKTA